MTTPEIHRATEELITWLLATRHDWTEYDVRAAIAGADTIAYGWARIARGLVALAVDPAGQPRALCPAFSRHERQIRPYGEAAADAKALALKIRDRRPHA